MFTHRKESVVQALIEAASTYLARISNKQSLITITRADVADNYSEATLFISVLPESDEDKALAFANRHLSEMHTYVSEHVRMKRTPIFTFVIDHGEKNRQALEDLKGPSTLAK
ncbi:MAG: ribosome-binding factor A [Patescibacteria group bacterium]